MTPEMNTVDDDLDEDDEDATEARIVQLALQAMRGAHAAAVASGAELVEIRGNQLVRFRGDQVLEVIRELPEPREVVPGTVVKLRRP
jgi:hypothetical protein